MEIGEILPKEVILVAMGGAYESGGGKVGFYRRLSYKQLSPTITTSPVQKATMLCHPRQDRPLSIKEYARIQQFSGDWKFTGIISAQYRQTGNAVSVGLAEAIGRAIISTASSTGYSKSIGNILWNLDRKIDTLDIKKVIKFESIAVALTTAQSSALQIVIYSA